ncbi:MAG: CoA transferase [Candidatus Tectomicrobia bacterium]
MVQPFLSHLRVLDFSWAAAGPYATELLGFMGAEILKVESARRLDLARRGFYQQAEPNTSTDFNDLNLNKRSLCINLSTQKGVGLIKRLVEHCDVVVENFRPGVMQRLGLDYDTLREINPRLIMASSSANGSTGPESVYAGYAGIFNALSGVGHLTGYRDGPPTEMRISMDLRVGLSLSFAILAALFARRRTGQGQHIDLSSREAITCLIGHSVLHYTMNGESLHRQGNQHDSMAPHGCYRCQGDDRWVTIAVGNEPEWQALCKAIGHPEWLQDSRFVDAHNRVNHRECLDALVTAWTQQYTPNEVTTRLQAAGVAAYPSMDSAMLAASEHLQARGVFAQVDHPCLGRQTVIGPPWRILGMPNQPDRPGPLLGEHTEVVLRDLLSMDEAEIRQLSDADVLE